MIGTTAAGNRIPRVICLPMVSLFEAVAVPGAVTRALEEQRMR